MKDGAKVLELGVPSLDLSRVCRGMLPFGTNAPPNDATDWARVCEGGVTTCCNGEGELKVTDFGRLEVVVPGDIDPFLENGLFRVCAMVLKFETMMLWPGIQTEIVFPVKGVSFVD